nr:hypothetical protein [Actinomycetota bacterium]
MTKKKKRRPGQSRGKRPAARPSGQTQPLRARPQPSAIEPADAAQGAGVDLTEDTVTPETATEPQTLAPTDGAAGRPGAGGRARPARSATSGARPG